MKKLLLLTGVILASFAGVHAQTPEGDVTFEMTDGTTKRGYSRTEMVNEVKFLEISAEPKGERTRYDNDQVARIVFDNGATYVKQDIVTKAKGDKTKNVWVLLEYQGNGIALYSAALKYMEQVNIMRRWVAQTNYYLSLGDDPAVWASTDYISGGVVNGAGANRSLLNYYFTKRYPEYSDLGKRVKAKEFDTKGSPIEAVRAWEEAYGNK